MRRFSPHSSRRSVSAFTLIELLVVIAIIAILTAILLPVFATVRENARASNSLSNMHQISTGLAQFQLDQHKYPDVLFGYVVSGASMDKAYDTAAATGPTPADGAAAVAASFPGLYPEYVKDYRVFVDPNNQAKFSDTSPALSVNVLGTNGKLTVAQKTFYTADSYDISPAITGRNSVSNGTSTVYVPRYQSSWTDIDTNLDCTNSAATNPQCSGGTTKENLYTHQLRWKNPPAQTYIASTTYHVPQSGRVLVLWENGSARKVDVTQFLQCDSATACDDSTAAGSAVSEANTDVSVAGGVSKVNFWKLDPTGP